LNRTLYIGRLDGLSIDGGRLLRANYTQCVRGTSLWANSLLATSQSKWIEASWNATFVVTHHLVVPHRGEAEPKDFGSSDPVR